MAITPGEGVVSLAVIMAASSLNLFTFRVCDIMCEEVRILSYFGYIYGILPL